jgi:hypothetical protein
MSALPVAAALRAAEDLLARIQHAPLEEAAPA